MTFENLVMAVVVLVALVTAIAAYRTLQSDTNYRRRPTHIAMAERWPELTDGRGAPMGDPTRTEAAPHAADQPLQEPADRIVHRFPEDTTEPPRRALPDPIEPVYVDYSAHRDTQGRELWH